MNTKIRYYTLICPSYCIGISGKDFVDDSLWSSVIKHAWNSQWNIETLVRDSVRSCFENE
jgi:hypothetical protein